MEAEQTYAGAELSAESDAYEEADKAFSDFFFELLSEQRY